MFPTPGAVLPPSQYPLFAHSRPRALLANGQRTGLVQRVVVTTDCRHLPFSNENRSVLGPVGTVIWRKPSGGGATSNSAMAPSSGHHPPDRRTSRPRQRPAVPHPVHAHRDTRRHTHSATPPRSHSKDAQASTHSRPRTARICCRRATAQPNGARTGVSADYRERRATALLATPTLRIHQAAMATFQRRSERKPP
jgi:hypothetical protein